MSCYSQYRGKSIGRQLHYIQEMCGLQYAEHVIFDGSGTITYFGEPFAKVSWVKTAYANVLLPQFEFLGKYKSFQNSQCRASEIASEDIIRELIDKLEKARNLLERAQKCAADSVTWEDVFRFRIVKGDIDRFLKDDDP